MDYVFNENFSRMILTKGSHQVYWKKNGHQYCDCKRKFWSWKRSCKKQKKNTFTVLLRGILFLDILFFCLILSQSSAVSNLFIFLYLCKVPFVIYVFFFRIVNDDFRSNAFYEEIQY